ncbi:pyruvate decarboxylase, partial [Aureobasidium melanogenum]|uniref:Pyruvate decarboxylase n=1 Tax=Aureobasidium melanogenum (strain CBS 110374) TaxID=1043003 RepID=A0A074W3J2_AURM1
MSSSSQDTITLADYVFARLHQLGIRSVFGVPGDYNLRLLDFVEPAGLHWVGNCNELNSAYAADAYARIHGVSALITTFGVGELSAVNGIAGAYAEKAPIISIVGTPARATQEARTNVHHTFADGDFNRFAAMHTHVTIAQTNLLDPRTAPEQFDVTVQQALIHSRPVYIQLPTDMVDVKVSAAGLKSKISLPPISSGDNESQVSGRILELMHSAKKPLIFVDGESRCLDILEEINDLVKATGWPVWTSPFGKGLVDEHLESFQGIYSADLGSEGAKSYFESADLALVFGPHYSSTNTGLFSSIPKQAISVSFSERHVKIATEITRDVSNKKLVAMLLEQLDHSKISKPEAMSKPSKVTSSVESSGSLTQKDFYRVINPMLKPGDIVMGETGTASHGTRDLVLPSGSYYFTAVTWLSIGYMLPAALGASLAQRDSENWRKRSGSKDTSKDRVVLFIGDGSLQMTVQEISTMIREKLNIIIVVINNDGYTIERVIHGRKQTYNDIAPWRYLQALNMFGATEEEVETNTFSARTWRELEAAIGCGLLTNGEGVKMLEVFMEREDAQGLLLKLLNNQKAREAEASKK